MPFSLKPLLRNKHITKSITLNIEIRKPQMATLKCRASQQAQLKKGFESNAMFLKIYLKTQLLNLNSSLYFWPFSLINPDFFMFL